MNNLIQRSFLNALGTVAYVSLVTMVMANGERIFNSISKTLGPIAFLTLFVLSASVTGGLVLGKPVLMYVNGQKSDAVKLFIFTLSWLAAALIVLFAAGLLFA